MLAIGIFRGQDIDNETAENWENNHESYDSDEYEFEMW